MLHQSQPRTTWRKRAVRYSQGVADKLPLLFGVRDALEALHEALRRVNDGEVDAEVLAEGLLDLLALVEAHEAMVDEDGVATVVSTDTYTGVNNIVR